MSFSSSIGPINLLPLPRMFQFLEADRRDDLQRGSLESRPVREFPEVLEPNACPLRQDAEHCEAEAIDHVPLLRRRQADTGPGFRSCLPLLIAGEASLQLEAPGVDQRIHERIIQVESLAGMNPGALLYGVEFVHLKCGERKKFAPGQV